MPCGTTATSLIARKGIEIGFARTEELEEIQSSVVAALANAQQDEVVFDGSFSEAASNYVANFRERLDCMFRIVVVPRNTVMVQKGEEFVSVLLESLLAFDCQFAFAVECRQLSIKSLDLNLIFPEETALQSSVVDSVNYGFEQGGKTPHDTLEFLIERVL